MRRTAWVLRDARSVQNGPPTPLECIGSMLRAEVRRLDQAKPALGFGDKKEWKDTLQALAAAGMCHG